LEKLHGVDLGQGYKNRQYCGVFVEYIAQYQHENLASKLGEELSVVNGRIGLV
jgi:hypothetical protein